MVRPNTAGEAVACALRLRNSGVYKLGAGDFTTVHGGESDCAGFAFCMCYGLRRHRPGFNVGSWASVSDDINCNSAIEDADHKQELFWLPRLGVGVGAVEVGDLLTYPTFTVTGRDGQPLQFIGHVAIVVGVPKVWAGKYKDLMVVQCCGPNGRTPGIIETDGSHWDAHDKIWPKKEHRTVVLRVKQVRQ